MPSSSKVVWRFTDGKKGHEKQTQGLIQGLESVAGFDFDIHQCDSSYSLRNLGHLPTPDLIIGAGHATHMPMLLARVLFGGRTVLLMKPSFPAVWFDLVFVPEHDVCTSIGNVHFTQGVLTPSIDREPSPNTGVIMLGGSSRHFNWNPQEIGEIATTIAQSSPDVTWFVCDSPRTPDSTLKEIEPLKNVEKRPWQETDETFLTDLLATSSATWVTCDSVTMLSEAMATQARVGVIMLEEKQSSSRKSKLIRGISQLKANNRIQLSTDGLVLDPAMAHIVRSNESERCATIVVQTLLDN